MAMSRKHYREVAEIIKFETQVIEGSPDRDVADAVLRRVAGELASFFKRDNGSFDRAKFMEACGL